MRIRLSHPNHLLQLAEALLAGNCRLFRINIDTLEVLYSDASDDAEAERTLRFFLQAWQMAHPHVTAELIPLR